MNRPAQFAPPFAALGFTAAEYLRMVATGGFGDARVELVEGELVKMMPSLLAHGEANALVAARVYPLFEATARIATDLMISVSPTTIRAADLAVVARTAPRDRPVEASDILLLVEVAASTLAEDLGAKLFDYASIGVPDYWVVDLEASVVHVMSEPEDGRYIQRRIVRFGEPVPVPGTDATIVID
jgi:Uma2 family endonuclease